MRNETRQSSQQRAGIRQQFSREQSTQPPFGGWNTRDAVDDIPPEDALILDNFTCGFGAVHVRKGSVPHAYSMTASAHTAGPVKTLAKYESGGVKEMIAADGGALWLATTAGPATILSSGYDNDVWSWTGFRGSADIGYLIMVNGVDAVQFNGTAVADLSPALNPAINPIGCYTFKNRVYYWEANAQSVWYTELYAHAGTITEFPLGDVGSFGGDLVAVISWTHDGGHGTDDYILFVMSSGEVLAYQGSFPADEADWALVGIYNAGRLMGPRSFVKFGGDLYLMTDLDIVPMSQLLAGVEQNRERTKISGAMQMVAALGGMFGFQAMVYPPSKLLIFNVPGDELDSFDQFVMNTVTRAWSRWKDRGSYCWLEFNGRLFYGGADGCVYEAESGYSDAHFASAPGGPVIDPGELPEALEVYDYIAGYMCIAGQARIELDEPPSDYEVNANFYDRFGNEVGPELLTLTVGTQFVLRTVDLSVQITVEVSGPLRGGWCSTQQTYYASIPVTVVSGLDVIPNGTQIQIVIGSGGVEPPPPGEEAIFTQVPIKSEVQTSWLRFGVEENKQFDACKIYFRSGVPVPHVLAFAVDYQRLPIFDYPDSMRGIGVPWSGEYTPPPGGGTIPDPTTWWTDEGANPPTPVNAVTHESGVGAITKWGLEATTTERWELVNGYGRAVSMLMRLATEEYTEWMLTFWHLKLGSRM